MSHIATVTTEIDNAEAIVLTAETMGLTVVRNARPRFYYSELTTLGTGYQEIVDRESKECEYVVKLPGRYDLGLKLNEQGKYDFVCDGELLHGDYGRASEGRKIVGEDGGTFLQEYAASVSTLWAQAQGMSVERELVNGQIELTLHGAV